MEYSNELLIEMLEIAMGAMVENEACSYCYFSGTSNCYNGCSELICKQGLFEGLKRSAEKELRSQQCA